MRKGISLLLVLLIFNTVVVTVFANRNQVCGIKAIMDRGAIILLSDRSYWEVIKGDPVYFRWQPGDIVTSLDAKIINRNHNENEVEVKKIELIKVKKIWDKGSSDGISRVLLSDGSTYKISHSDSSILKKWGKCKLFLSQQNTLVNLDWMEKILLF